MPGPVNEENIHLAIAAIVDTLREKAKKLEAENDLLKKDLEAKHGLATECFNLTKELAEKKQRIEVLENELMRIAVQTPEEKWLEIVNGGATSFALQLLKDDGRGEMSPGPCADALRIVRDLKKRVEELEGALKANSLLNASVENEVARQMENECEELRKKIVGLEGEVVSKSYADMLVVSNKFNNDARVRLQAKLSDAVSVVTALLPFHAPDGIVGDDMWKQYLLSEYNAKCFLASAKEAL